jgi:riboflavin transporter FmnP
MALSDNKGTDDSLLFMPLSVRIALLAVFSALGMVLRLVAIPTGSPYVTLTPGFTIPLLTGIVLGPIAGVICGLMVGISGAITEPALIPVIGNMALGLSTGIPTIARRRLPRFLWASICITSATVIGGFLPTFCGEIIIYCVLPVAAAVDASIDAAQAAIWAIVALILEASVVQPLLERLLHYFPS